MAPPRNSNTTTSLLPSSVESTAVPSVSSSVLPSNIPQYNLNGRGVYTQDPAGSIVPQDPYTYPGQGQPTQVVTETIQGPEQTVTVPGGNTHPTNRPDPNFNPNTGCYTWQNAKLPPGFDPRITCNQGPQGATWKRNNKKRGGIQGQQGNQYFYNSGTVTLPYTGANGAIQTKEATVGCSIVPTGGMYGGKNYPTGGTVPFTTMDSTSSPISLPTASMPPPNAPPNAQGFVCDGNGAGSTTNEEESKGTRQKAMMGAGFIRGVAGAYRGASNMWNNMNAGTIHKVPEDVRKNLVVPMTPTTTTSSAPTSPTKAAHTSPMTKATSAPPSPTHASFARSPSLRKSKSNQSFHQDNSTMPLPNADQYMHNNFPLPQQQMLGPMKAKKNKKQPKNKDDSNKPQRVRHAGSQRKAAVLMPMLAFGGGGMGGPPAAHVQGAGAVQMRA